MNEKDIRTVGESGPIIDSIEVAEFETHSDLKEGLSKRATAFVHCTSTG
jgi:hypothetical protein